MGAAEFLHLKRSNFEKCVSNSFKDLLSHDEFVDVTLVSEDGKEIKAHKVVLGSCSSVLKSILTRNTGQHPIIYMLGVKYKELNSLVNFIYLGQTEIPQDNLELFMNIALRFEVQGLFDKDKRETCKQTTEEQLTNAYIDCLDNTSNKPLQNEECWEEENKVHDNEELKAEGIVDVVELESLNEEVIGINDDIPKLPFPVSLLAESEARAWLLPELKKDLVENGSKPVTRIFWGDEKYRPKCWANDLAEWKTVSNISQAQKNKLQVPIVRVLKATIRNRLMQKNINPDEHVDDTGDNKEKERRKMMSRGWHKINMTK